MSNTWIERLSLNEEQLCVYLNSIKIDSFNDNFYKEKTTVQKKTDKKEKLRNLQ